MKNLLKKLSLVALMVPANPGFSVTHCGCDTCEYASCDCCEECDDHCN
ncbi:MAG: hypothetical protein AB8C84_06500 [Oligoflexales bacterium]